MRYCRRLAGPALLWFAATAIVGACLPADTATAQLNPLNVIESVVDRAGGKISDAVRRKKKGKVDPRAVGKGRIDPKAAKKGRFDPRAAQKKRDLAGPGGRLQKGKDGKSRDFRSVKGKEGKGKDIRAAKGKEGKGKDLRSAKGRDGKGKDIRSKSAKAVDGRSKFGKGKDARPKLGAGKASPFRAKRTPVQRRLFEAGHRKALATARARLPRRLLPGQPGFTGVPPATETRYVATDMMFGVGPNVSPQAVQAIAQRHGLTVVGSHNMGLIGETVYQLRLASGRRVADTVRALEAERVGLAQPNYVYRTQQPPPAQSSLGQPESNGNAAERGLGDPAQYVISKLRLDEVHRLTRGSSVLVAVIDSQIDIRHPDLDGAIVEQFDAVGTAGAPHAHGTGMVGAIAAHRKLMGIAPGAKILSVRAFSPDAQKSPQATTRHIIAGLDWAIGKGARVVNMSFAGPYDPMLSLAMKRAHDKGVVLIAAAGNAGPKSRPLYPAADQHVIAVTATDENDKLLPQAVRGPHLAVSAPGVEIMVPAPDEAYQLTTGTSVAAAHVSGIAALLIDRHPTVSSATILEVLTATARKLNPKGRDDQFGWGLVDPAAALEELDERMAAGAVASAQPPAGAQVPAQPLAQPVPLPVPRPAARQRAAPRSTDPIRIAPLPAASVR